jgi:arginine exporter protein ArgO
MHPIVGNPENFLESSALHGTNSANRSTEINITFARIAFPTHSLINFFVFAHIATSMDRYIADIA